MQLEAQGSSTLMPPSNGEFLQFLIAQSIKMINTMKRHSNWAYYSYEEYPNKETVLSTFFSLLTRLNQASSPSQIQASEVLNPYLKVIQGDDVPATVTLTSLRTIHSLLSHDSFVQLEQNQEFFHYLVFFLTSCQFETSDLTSAELIIFEILKIFKLLLANASYCIYITDDMACGICQVVFSICVHPKIGELLKKIAEMEAVEILNLIFSTLHHLTLKQDAEQTKEVALKIGKRHSFDMDQLKESIQEHSQSTAAESSFGLPCIREILSYLGSCLDDQQQQQQQLSNSSSSLATERTLLEKNRLFCSFILRSLMEKNAKFILKFPSCLVIVKECIIKKLLLHTMEMEALVYLQNCTIILNACFSVAKSSLSSCIELYLSILIDRLSKPTSPKARLMEANEILFYALYELLSNPGFPMFIFQRFDASPGGSFLFDKLMKFLTLKEQQHQSQFSCHYWMRLNGLLVILLSLWKASLNPSIEFEQRENLHSSLCTDLLNQLSSKRQHLECASKFNEKPQLAISLLKDLGIIASVDDTRGIAKFLFEEQALDKAKIGLFISKYPDYNKAILMDFMKLFDFTNQSLDQALRAILSHFRLPGEAQQISNIMEAFAAAYAPHAATVFENKDAVFVLSYSIIMLNTDLHNSKVKNKMSLQEFIRNNSTANNGKDFCPDYLQQVYQNIKDQEIVFPHDDQYGRDYFAMQWIKVLQAEKSNEFCFSHDPKMNHSLLLLYLDPMVDFVFSVLEATKSAQIFDDCRQVLWILFSFCKHFKDFDSFENVLASLITHVNNSNFDAKDSKFVEILHFLIVVLNQNITLLHLQGWMFLFDLLEKLFVNNLIPKALALRDQHDEQIIPIQPATPAKKVSIISALTNILTRSSTSLPDSEKPRAPAAGSEGQQLSQDWKEFVQILEKEGLLFDFVKASSDISLDVLELVLDLISAEKLSSNPHSAVLFVEIYSNICLENMHRIDKLFPKFFTTMTKKTVAEAEAGDNSENQETRERALLAMIRMIEQLAPLQSATSFDQIEACLVHLHTALQSPNNASFAPQAFNGIVGVCRSFARSHMQNHALWSVLYSIVGFAACSPRLEPWATECLLIFLEEIDQFFSFPLFFTLLQQFPLQNANVYHAFFAVLLQVLSQLPAPADSQGEVCENAFQILFFLTRALKVPVCQQIAMTSLQRAFLHSDLMEKLQCQIKRLFDEVLFPCMVECVDCEARQRLLGLVTKAFLHCLHGKLLDESVSTLEIWSTLLQMYTLYYDSAVGAAADVEQQMLLREAVREYFKNVVSVLLNLNVLPLKQQGIDAAGWSATWEAIKKILPAFYYEHFPEPSAMSVNNDSLTANNPSSVPIPASEEIYL